MSSHQKSTTVLHSTRSSPPSYKSLTSSERVRIKTRISNTCLNTNDVPRTKLDLQDDLRSDPKQTSAALGWRRLDQTHYVRDFDPLEISFDASCHDPSRPSHRSLDIFVRIAIDTCHEPRYIIEIMKKAWMEMRYLHPTLAAEVLRNKFRYTAITEKFSITDWVQETFVVQEFGTTMGDGKYQDLSVAKRINCPTLYYYPSERIIFFRCNHLLIDGKGVVFLFQDLLTEMARLEAGGDIFHHPLGQDVKNLPSSTFDAAKISRSNPSWNENCLSKLPGFRENIEAFEIPSKNNMLEPGPGKVQSLELSEHETEDLMASAKRYDLGITVFVHAALLQAGKKFSPETNHTTHSTTLILNLRKYCRSSRSDADRRAIALRIGFYPVQVEIGNFIETASHLKYHYKMITSQAGTIMSIMPPLLEQSAAAWGKTSYKSIIPNFVGDLTPFLSGTYGSFKFKEFWAVGIPTDERVYLGIQSSSNKLSIRAAYNETYHDDQQLAQYLNLIKQELLAAMVNISSHL